MRVTLAYCVNVPLSIAAVISSEQASLRELEEYYGLEDVYDMLEIVEVKNYNETLLSKRD
jgi:hypothetical protein